MSAFIKFKGISKSITGPQGQGVSTRLEKRRLLNWQGAEVQYTRQKARH